MGYEILDIRRRKTKPRKVTAFYEEMLEAVLELGRHATRTMKRPQLYMYTFRFSEAFKNYPIDEVLDRIRRTYTRPKKGKITATGTYIGRRQPEYCHQPLMMWCRELSTHPDHEYSGHEHYHLLIIVDRQKGRIGAAKHVIKRLRIDDGIIEKDYISKISNSVKHACTELKKDFSDYMYRASYICKVDTKMTGRRNWSKSQLR